MTGYGQQNGQPANPMMAQMMNGMGFGMFPGM